MLPNWLISVGDVSELLRPVWFALAALASSVVLGDSRRLGLPPLATAGWALGALAAPAVALPLYLAARLYTPRAAEPDPPPPLRQRVLRGAVPVAYAAALFALGAACFYLDSQSADARLQRANRAILHNRPERAAAEYRAALRAGGDDPHTRKLLGLALAAAGRREEALAEFRAAARSGQPADDVSFHAARTLEALARRAEAAAEYQQFLESPSCTRQNSVPECLSAAARLQSLTATGSLP